jgi:arylsulfatase A-like enzyme
MNVLFLMSDDMRPDLGCYGHNRVRSPHLDALASQGVRFDRAYCQYPLCNPSRSSMLTGRLPTTTGVLDNRLWFGAAHPDWVTLPRHFKNHGYSSLRAGKIFHGGIDDTEAWSVGGEKRNFEGAVSPGPSVQGADRAKNSDRTIVLDDDAQHIDLRTTERAISLLREYANRPFFFACGFSKPHSPPSAPKAFFDLYHADRIALPANFAPTVTVPANFPPRSLTRNGDLFINRPAQESEARQMTQAYWASISWVDWNVGRILNELDRLHLRDKTIVLFWGDHGYHLGEWGKWSKHGSLFEVGTRVPLIIHDPRSKSNGQAITAPVQAMDLYPTLCQLCQLPAPNGLEGHSLSPLLVDASAPWPHPAVSVYGSEGKLGVAVRDQRYRYVEYDGGQSGAMLFDEQSDPNEQTNRVDDPSLTEVRDRLAKTARQVNPPR